MKQYNKDLGKVCVTTGGDYNPGNSYEILTIVYDDSTKKSYLSKQDVPVGINIDNKLYWQPIGSGKTSDDRIINLSYADETGKLITYTLSEAIKKVNIEDRRVGCLLTFYRITEDITSSPAWCLYQFNSISIDDWENTSCWKDIYYNRSKFVGWFDSASELRKEVSGIPGDYAYVGTNFNNSTLYKCDKYNIWTDTKESIRDFLEIVISGDLSIGVNGNWLIKGRDTGISAVGVKEVDSSVDALPKRSKPSVRIDVDDIPENLSKKLTFVFGIPLPIDANITSVSAEATTLNYSQSATVEVEKKGEADDTQLKFKFGIPQGQTGSTGPAAGFGEVTAEAEKLEADVNPTVDVETSGSNTTKNIKFSFGIPKGTKGDKGDKGDVGPAAGFGQATATVEMVDEAESPSCTITESGEDTAKIFNFAFKIPYKTSSTVQVQTTPEDATVKINGVEKKSEVVTNGSKVTIEVSKPGYDTDTQNIIVNSDIINKVNLVQIAPQKMTVTETTISGIISTEDDLIPSRGGQFKITVKGTAVYSDGTQVENQDLTDFIIFNIDSGTWIKILPHGTIQVGANNDKNNNKSYIIKGSYTNFSGNLDNITLNFTQSKNLIKSYKDLVLSKGDDSEYELNAIPGHATGRITIKGNITSVYEDDSTAQIVLPLNGVSGTSSNQDWANVLTDDLSIIVEDNNTNVSRTATITVTTTAAYSSLSANINITQVAIENDELEVSPLEVEIPAEGGSSTINITSNTDWVIE